MFQGSDSGCGGSEGSEMKYSDYSPRFSGLRSISRHELIAARQVEAVLESPAVQGVALTGSVFCFRPVHRVEDLAHRSLKVVLRLLSIRRVSA